MTAEMLKKAQVGAAALGATNTGMCPTRQTRWNSERKE